MSKTPVAELVDQARAQFTYGADYNPEQWAPEVWVEDARLMQQAGVNLVAINIFGWAQLEPLPGQYDFSSLDAVIEVLHEHGIGINLGTGTSSPPAWLAYDHPDSLPTMADGTQRYFGGRQAFCPSSPAYREHSLRLVEQVARRHGAHPAVKLWHVSNEIGCHNAHCYCAVSAEAFRGWLRERYVTLDALNDAWGTAFWSQKYGAWEHIQTPRLTVSTGNPGQALDFMRFSSDELLGQYRAEEAVLREHSAAPVTTNFMVTAHIRNQDYWAWAPHMDIVANDHYLDHRLANTRDELSFAADTTRGLAGGDPWMLMESATSAVNWQPRNIAKTPREMIRNSLSHVARGADGISFFQWRASLQGSEKFHSAMLPHAGEDSKVWREVVELGETLAKLAEVTGTRVVTDVALVFDWQAWWATDLDSHPTGDISYLDQVHRVYNALLAEGFTVDIVAPGASLEGHRFVVVPSLYAVSDADAASLADFVASGGHAVVTFFSGIVDGNDRVRAGGYPGAFRDLLGVSTEEFFPVEPGVELALSNGSTATTWAEWVHLRGASAVTTFESGPLVGVPAVTRNEFGDGTAWYLATNLDPEGLRGVLATAALKAGVATPVASPDGVEIIRRSGDTGDFLFVINHTDAPFELSATGTDLITDTAVEGTLAVAAGEVRVVRESRDNP
ncbi:beta-galactosidase [Conyzicola nivalis]|uniref:Beta-galactosidase n=1 Tax=Conyzicola nivalis TaxID=1477021 RepID=A0A916SPY6_9MICO|nr:beta-galactosidase [Conyzicola nivalis]GGB07893.1 beta-galactosidase [Conyzicola nivalis]